MKQIKVQLVRDFKLDKLGYDFMGYKFDKGDVSYHHLIVPKRLGGQATYENGSILMQSTAHNYLHTIERYDGDIYNCINKAMMISKQKERIDKEELQFIKDCLLYFEAHYGHLKNQKGSPIIKEKYLSKRI